MFRRNSSRHWNSGPTPFIHMDCSSRGYLELYLKCWFSAPLWPHRCSNGRFIDETTRWYTPGGRFTGQIQSINVTHHDTQPKVQSLLQEFPKITKPRTEQPLVFNTKLTQVRDTGEGTPTYAKVRQLSEDKYKSSKQEFTALLQAGVIRPSKSWFQSQPKRNSRYVPILDT